MSDVCKPGDIVRAKVISEKNRVFHLSTNDKNLGILYGFCSRDGTLLEQQRYDDLKCPKCGNMERRKVAPDYGKEPV
jgi:exosome complex component CSL4